ncbi:CDP-glycerol glycerophosphotransferase family protein [Selenomonas sp. FC4001]|uniref:CDP-glycerol glycerophosphotransferase family protein n=1 Tax=Selenomonas sp. FC4001 TaxID=1408313 RepID=UPI00055FBE35|nr:CDP-glycerol glycerophosphotransferase family protein [Selenomonas sp. FC4001]
MKKIQVVLLVLNQRQLESILSTIRLERVELCAVLVDYPQMLPLEKLNISRELFCPFSDFLGIKTRYSQAYWLLAGFKHRLRELGQMAKWLERSGIKRDRIVNYSVLYGFSRLWMENLRLTEQKSFDYFATGISYTEVGLDTLCLPGCEGINLSLSSQDLQTGYQTAQYVFAHQPEGSIKFVLIGLAPYSLHYYRKYTFSSKNVDLMYQLTLGTPTGESNKARLVHYLLPDWMRNIYFNITGSQADANYNQTKSGINQNFTIEDFLNIETDYPEHDKKDNGNMVASNVEFLKAYIALCHKHHAVPVLLMWPFARILQEQYPTHVLETLYTNLKKIRQEYAFEFVDLFDMKLDYSCFYNVAHLNRKGARLASNELADQLRNRNVLPRADQIEPAKVTYAYLFEKIQSLSKEDYQQYKKDMLQKTIKLLQKKRKIRVAFFLYDYSMWCGDDLYQYLVHDKCFEPVIYLCLRADVPCNKKIKEDFENGIKVFREKGMQVVPVTHNTANIDHNDLIFYMTPYTNVFPTLMQPQNISMNTLLAYIPYGFYVWEGNGYKSYNLPLFSLCWKIFFSTNYVKSLFEQYASGGITYGCVTGNPRTDYFYNKNNHNGFVWKKTNSNAVKIIYAPHWGISAGAKFSTFHWNYAFMLEYARQHPETSWVVKPHPNLSISAVSNGVFASNDDYNAYLAKWDALPNAQVFTGGYYQEIFSSSDAMILDSSSFLVEYQYTHKPILFLRREEQKFNGFGEALLERLYQVNGHDFNGIAKFIEEVLFSEKDDEKVHRLEFFYKNLDYLSDNGCLASEKIYHELEDLKE